MSTAGTAEPMGRESQQSLGVVHYVYVTQGVCISSPCIDVLVKPYWDLR
jgi:hypothetical protein